MLVLDEKALKQLNDFIQEMPVKFGLPLLQFINAKLTEQNKPAEQTVTKEAEKKSE